MIIIISNSITLGDSQLYIQYKLIILVHFWWVSYGLNRYYQAYHSENPNGILNLANIQAITQA